MPKNYSERLKIFFHSRVWKWRHSKGVYVAAETIVIERLLMPTDTCIDIGAHAGSWTLPLAKMVPAGRVIAFEALPYYAEVLKLLVRSSNCRNVEIFNFAVSDSDGSTEIAWRQVSGRKLTGNTHVVTADERSSMECVQVAK